MRALFLPLGDPREIPGDRYRYWYYRPYLQERGHEVCYVPFVYPGYFHDLSRRGAIGLLGKIRLIRSMAQRYLFLQENLEKFDVVVICKEVFKRFPYWAEERILQRIPYVVDLDDNPQHAYQNNYWARRIAGPDKIGRLLQNASLVTVGNHWYFQEFPYPNLTYLPTVVDISRYNPKGLYETSIPTIVWIGTYSTIKYLELVRPALRQLAGMRRFRFRVIGGHFHDDAFETENLVWSEVDEAAMIAAADIGIMPLEDSYWEKGKCGFKLIQYMAAGLPVVASPAPANEEIVVPGDNGYLARTVDEWVASLARLLDDAGHRKDLGRHGRQAVEARYSYQVWGPRFVQLLEEVVARSQGGKAP